MWVGSEMEAAGEEPVTPAWSPERPDRNPGQVVAARPMRSGANTEALPRGCGEFGDHLVGPPRGQADDDVVLPRRARTWNRSSDSSQTLRYFADPYAASAVTHRNGKPSVWARSIIACARRDLVTLPAAIRSAGTPATAHRAGSSLQSLGTRSVPQSLSTAGRLRPRPGPS